MYIGVIPAESVPIGLMTSAIGLTTAAGEVIGGVIAPSVAGALADGFGLEVPFYACIACAVLCGLLAIGLEETVSSARAR